MPRLRTVTLRLAPNDRLLKSALSQATGFVIATVVEPQRARSIRAIRSAPALRKLVLSAGSEEMFDDLDGDPIVPLGSLMWNVPTTITILELQRFSVEPEFTPRSKALFLRTPALRKLCLVDMAAQPMLRGLLDAGVSALPDLRLVELWMLTCASWTRVSCITCSRLSPL